MHDEEAEADRLRTPATVHLADSRWRLFAATDPETGERRAQTLEGRHAAIAAIRLRPEVPLAVRVQFETARNLHLYSWFVYRFAPIADLQAYATAEMALRDRATREGLQMRRSNRGHVRPRTFTELFDLAIERRWITDAEFEAVRDGHASRREPGPTLPDDAHAVAGWPPKLDDQTYCRGLRDTMTTLRNVLAHGSPTVYPGSLLPLINTRDLIGQLYPPRAEITAAAPPPPKT